MAVKWFYTPAGEPAFYQSDEYVWDTEGKTCLYWEANGWWFRMEDSAPAYFLKGPWVFNLMGEQAFYTGQADNARSTA
ncbi:hypothetical protein [Brevundimonas sp.]|uniref:hypothetical protein n=1 Tax=Brevundimonas sp. TaxID=1871086 RepID=UPI001D5415B8|nr:hypothetical protein [Brevundimonas sp.]MBA4000293.1 hypothetical protein [Brevundimonas sp.]